MSTGTFTEESAGVADLITSCSGGRNYRCAKMSVERRVSIEEVEREELNGQMLQGLSTAKDVHEFLKKRGKEREFPLLVGTYRESLSFPFWLSEMVELIMWLQEYYEGRSGWRIYRI